MVKKMKIYKMKGSFFHSDLLFVIVSGSDIKASSHVNEKETIYSNQMWIKIIIFCSTQLYFFQLRNAFQVK